MNNSNKVLIKYIEDLARLKKIKTEDLLEILIDSIKESWQRRYEDASPIEVLYDDKENNIIFFQYLKVVSDEKRYDPYFEVSYKLARRKNPNIKVDDMIREECNPELLFSRVMIDEIKKEMNKKIFIYHRNKEYDKFIPLLDTVQQGVIKGSFGKNLIVEIDESDVLLPSIEQVRKEKLYKGEKIYVYILNVERKYIPKEYQVTVSRKNSGLVTGLVKLFVPEVGDKIIIEKVARVFGYKSNIGLRTLDENLNPVSVAIGYKGSRIKSIRKELHGEKIDFFAWSDNLEKLVKNAMIGINVESVQYDRQNDELKIVVQDRNIEAAIGMEGKNSKLLSMILPNRIEKLSIIPASKAKDITYNIKDILNLDDDIYDILSDYKINTINIINHMEVDELKERIPELNEEIIEEIKNRVNLYIKYEKEIFESKYPESDVFMYSHLDPVHSNILASNNILTVKQIHDINIDYLIELLGQTMKKKDIIALKI